MLSPITMLCAATKENDRLRGRLLFCDLGSDVRPKRELSVHGAQAPTGRV